METEKHMSQLSQREIGRLQQEIKRLEARVDEIKERKNIHENSIFNNTQQLERLKAQMNWDQQVRVRACLLMRQCRSLPTPRLRTKQTTVGQAQLLSHCAEKSKFDLEFDSREAKRQILLLTKKRTLIVSIRRQ